MIFVLKIILLLKLEIQETTNCTLLFKDETFKISVWFLIYELLLFFDIHTDWSLSKK